MNENNYDICLEYLGKKNINYYDSLKNQIDKILFIKNFDISKFSKNIIILLNKLSYKDINISYDILYSRINKYFNKQRTVNNVYQIKSIIKYQFMISNYCNKLIYILIKSYDIRNVTETSSILLNKDNKLINIIFSKYLSGIKLKYLKQNTQPKHFNHKESKSISTFLEIILKLLLKQQNNQMLCYGSFTCYNINQNLKYNDIDLYHLKSYKFCIFLMVLVYFIFDMNVYIFSIPFIVGHMSIKYESDYLIDCIYLPKNIIEIIPKVLINNINFVNPGLQMLNNIRMGVEFFRSYKIYTNLEDVHSKYTALLNNFITNNNFFKGRKLEYWYNRNLNKKDIKYYFEKDNLIINLKELIPNPFFDKIIVSFADPNIFINNLKDIDGLFSRKYHAFLNEIFFETRYINIAGKTSYKTITVDEENMLRISRKNKFNTFLDKDIYNNSIILSNLTTSVFVKTENGQLCDISFRNITSVIATVVLYSFLHKRDKFATNLYYILLSMICNINEDISTFECINRYKLKGEHKKLSIHDDTLLDIRNKDHNDKQFLTYEEFISIY